MSAPSTIRERTTLAKSTIKAESNGGARSRDREERWDEIVLAAAKVFYEKSYEGASLQDIASAVGLLKGSVYYYIDTKEDLLFELVMRAQAVWRATLEEDDELAAAPATVRLREFILRWMLLKEQHREWGIVAEREFTRLSPDYLKKVIVGRRTFSNFVEAIISQGIADGEFDDRINLALATNMVFELMKSSHLNRMPGTRAGVIEFADAYSLLLIRGLGKADWVAPSATK
jgi:AcrR family transcriptional regulator